MDSGFRRGFQIALPSPLTDVHGGQVSLPFSTLTPEKALHVQDGNHKIGKRRVREQAIVLLIGLHKLIRCMHNGFSLFFYSDSYSYYGVYILACNVALQDSCVL